MSQEPLTPGAAQVPTLLIGLGGYGSMIVDEIYDRIPAERRRYVGVHAFDTDHNALSDLRHLTDEQRTQTSTRQRVRDYLAAVDESVNEWFPENRFLRSKSLTEGAGQVRVNSRLAFRAAVERDGLGKLRAEIARVFRRQGTDLKSNARIAIVSSLAGGTGAGIFLQVALFLRELLLSDLGRETVLVRGAFVLPDIFVLTKTVDSDQGARLRANAYACLKELDAVLQNAAGTRLASLKPLELEYNPSGRAVLGEVHLPYDLCFLYDFEDAAGNNLGPVLSHYTEQVVQTLYLQLFSPLAKSFFSTEDNLISKLSDSRGRGRFCGAGVARLIYPREEILDYLARRWTSSTLSADWLRIDALVEEEFREYERDIARGVYRPEKPTMARRYPILFEQMANAESPEPFFRTAFISAHVLDEKNQTGIQKAEAFVAAVSAEIDRLLQGDADIQQAESDCTLDDEALKDRKSVKKEISRMEDALYTLRETVFKAVHEHKVAIVNDVVARDCDRPTTPRGGDHQLNTWILKKDEPLHPVAVRYVLYRVRALLVDEQGVLRVRTAQTLRSIQEYGEKYDLDETEDVVETIDDRLGSALDQPVLARVLRNNFKELVEEYREKSSAQVSALKRFKGDRLREMVYSGILEAVDRLIESFERLFRDIRDIRNDMMDEVNAMARSHEDRSDRTRVYVLASAAAKDALWRDVRAASSLGALPPGIAQEIYIAEYRRLCAALQRPDAPYRAPSETRELFNTKVVGWCRDQLRQEGKLDIDVISALERDAEIRGVDSAEHVRQTIRSIENLADPLLSAGPLGDSLGRWGLGERTRDAISEDEFTRLFVGKVVVSDEFSDYEVDYTTSRYDVMASDLRKCQPADTDSGGAAGAYLDAYERLRERLNREPDLAITPHLDKRWHLGPYLAELNESAHTEAEARVDRALIFGLTYRLLQLAKRDRRDTWVYVGDSEETELRIDGRVVSPHFVDLAEALAHNPAVVDDVLRTAERMRMDDLAKYRADGALTAHRFIQQVGQPIAIGADYTNLLDAVVHFGELATDRDHVRARRLVLLGSLLDTVHGYYARFFGIGQPNSAVQAARRLLERLAEASPALKDASNGRDEFAVLSDRISQYFDDLERRA